MFRDKTVFVSATSCVLPNRRHFWYNRFFLTNHHSRTDEGNIAVIEGVAGTTYQIIVNKKVRTIESRGIDRVEF